MDKCEIITFADDKQLARAAAERWLEWLAAAGNRNPLLVALSGGRIARTFFTAAATLGKSKQNLFNPVHFFWADERCADSSDPR